MTDFINIDHLIDTAKNRVKFVGVELEGAWNRLPPGVDRLEPDGSVYNNRKPGLEYVTGELPIGPAPIKAIPALVAANYPQKANHTCGMHVHMSFDTLWYYNLLMIPEYQETVLEYLLRWAKTEPSLKADHCIWSRLRGESEYCRKEFWPDVQASTKRKSHDRQRPGNRYTVIHYCGRQNTIECRVLPMMPNSVSAVRGIQRVVAITNACIAVLGAQDERAEIKGKVTLPNGAVYEYDIEEVIK